MKNLHEIEEQIVKVIENVVLSYRESGKNHALTWITDKLKKDLGALGAVHGFETRSSLHKSELIFDLSWLKMNVNNIAKVILAFESEISERSLSGLKRDFYKLLIANADYRVMFVTSCLNKNYDVKKFLDYKNQVLNDIRLSIEHYENLKKGDRFLIIIWDDFVTDELFWDLIEK